MSVPSAISGLESFASVASPASASPADSTPGSVLATGSILVTGSGFVAGSAGLTLMNLANRAFAKSVTVLFIGSTSGTHRRHVLMAATRILRSEVL